MNRCVSQRWKDCLLLAVSSLALAMGQLSSPQPGHVVLATPGDSVNVSLPLPPSLSLPTVLVVSFNTPSTVLFLWDIVLHHPPPYSTLSSPMVMPDYSQRLQVEESLAEGVINFTLINVTSADGGRYICSRGLTEADILEDCGNTLVVLEAPINARVIPERTPMTGNDVTLRCTATSTSTPRDHHQPMKFRWFEAQRSNRSVNVAATWTETYDTKSNLLAPNVDHDAGSGEIVYKDGEKGNNSDSLSDVLTLTSLARSDEGRRFACVASEGLGLWSSKSAAFVLEPEWKPLPSDLTLTPAGTSMTLTSGESQEVTCQARCRPACHVVWKKVKWDNHSLTLAKTGTLKLQRVGPQHQGLYHCVASNPHGSALTPLTLTVLAPPTPWYQENRYVIMVVALVTVAVALGMAAVAVVVYKCRQRASPFVWPHRRANHDAVPLSMVANRYTEDRL